MIATILTTLKNLKNYIVILLVSSLLIIGSYHYGNSTGYTSGYERRDEIATQDIKNMKYNYNIELQREKDLKQNEVNKIKGEFNTKLSNLQKTTDNVVTNLNADNVRLRIQIKRSSSSNTNTSECSTTGKSNDYVELSERSSRFLIGQSIKADDWVNSLQKLVLKLNENNQKLMDQLKEKK
ncbi:hypothetical protein [Yersinia enterocolitica]